MDRTHDVQQQIERISKHYRPNITHGFDINQFRMIRSLGQGMNGAVRAENDSMIVSASFLLFSDEKQNKRTHHPCESIFDILGTSVLEGSRSDDKLIQFSYLSDTPLINSS